MKKIILFIIILFIWSCKEEKKQSKTAKKEKKEVIIKDYDLIFNNFHVVRDTLKSGDTFTTIINKYKLSDSLTSGQLDHKVRDTFNLNKIQKGKEIINFLDKKDKKTIKAIVYPIDKSNYLFIDLRDSLFVQKKSKPTIIKRITVASELNGSLYESLERNGIDGNVAPQIAKIYQYSIDFFKIKRGDKFAITVKQKYFENGEYVAVEEIEASYFEYKGKKIYAFPYQLYEKQKKVDFYDENGKGLKNMFLKSPLNYFRISSRFTKMRFHPVQLRWKAHNGTDYAAPHGTPIKTTASGIVEKAGYQSGNGNFVKVKHNGTYSTQYLHMSKILVRKGQRVEQGHIIGKVGSTGLATGPHVCYRFWKNGVQVDALRLKLPNAEPMDKNQKKKYLEKITPLKNELDQTTTKIFKEED